jgi:cellulose synthase/poly-beta-1,6-N-acetylglucosamine synthase-like glycosyltransferase
MAWVLFIGLNAAVWGCVGIVRFVVESNVRWRSRERIRHFFALARHALDTNERGFKPDVRASVIGGCSGAVFFTLLVTFSTESFLGGTFPERIFFATALLWIFGASAAGFLAAAVAASRGQSRRIMGSGVLAGGILTAVELTLAFVTLPGLDLLHTTIRLSTFLMLLWLSIAALVAGTSGAYIVRTFVLFAENPLPKLRKQAHTIDPREVCSLTAAHNEELTIGHTLASLKRILPAENMYVASDASTDRTVSIVREAGAYVLDIWPNKGKANALVHAITMFKLLDHYKAIMIVDADSEVGEQYLEYALPFFDDPKTAAVAVHAMSKWRPHMFPERRLFYTAYRVRLYRVLQAIFRYGQTWGRMGLTPIIPGFASIYRTSVVRELEINAPGLVIEDFNMTFEVHRKKLGRIAYSPRVNAASQDPMRLKDYMKQVKRWNLGFWQTVFKNGVWRSVFWLTLGAFLLELVIVSLLSLALPLFAALLIFDPHAIEIPLPFPPFSMRLTFLVIGLGFLISDILVTIIVALYERKPVLILYAPGFIVLRYIDTFLFLSTFFLALRKTKATGIWTSPKRQAL